MSRRRGTLVLALFLAVWLIPAPAMADVPANDEIAGAVAIDTGALPFHDSLDTTMATMSDADLAAALQCEGPPDYAAGVWYSITPAAGIGIGIDTSGSDYSTGVMVFTGPPDALELATCFPGGGPLLLEGGATTHIMIFDDQVDGGGNGGMLELHVFDLGEELCPGLFEADPLLGTGNLILGTDGDDEIKGTMGRDIIVGLDGNDTIHGLKGDDVLIGCEGDDHLDGGPGDDEVHGDAFGYFGNPDAVGGNDFAQGRGGNDLVFGGPGDDILRGGFGSDFVVGHQGDDLIKGHRGDDELLGGLGNDRVEGHKGNDFLSGGWGDDFLKAGRGDDVMTGSPPAFPPDAADPEPDANDICRGGPGADFGWHCESLFGVPSTDAAFELFSKWGLSQYNSPRFGR